MVKEFQPLPASLAQTGAEVVLGEARFSDPHTIAVNGSALWGEKIIIGAGSTPVLPEVPGIDAAITSDEILFLPVFPTRLVIIGAGAVGLEMAGASLSVMRLDDDLARLLQAPARSPFFQE